MMLSIGYTCKCIAIDAIDIKANCGFSKSVGLFGGQPMAWTTTRGKLQYVKKIKAMRGNSEKGNK